MKKLITLALAMFYSLAFFNVTGCTKINVPDGTPRCIKKKIKEIQSLDVQNPPATIWKYEYHGKTVYYFPPRCCDVPSDLYDNHCNLICHPDGGFTGGGDGKCTDFFKDRTNEELVWKDERN